MSLFAAGTASAAEQTPQTLRADFSQPTGAFLGGSSGTLYGLGDDGSPTDAILSGASVENSSQKPPTGTQHPSGDALALEDQFFANGGQELAVYIQDYYPDWAYNHGKRPDDNRMYKLDVPVDDPQYGTYTEGEDGIWDYLQVEEIVLNKILANTAHPDNYTFIPFNEPDGGNWYYTGDDANNSLFKDTFLKDWDDSYNLIQKVWNEYKSGAKKASVKPTASLASVAGPGDSSWKPNRSAAFLQHTKAANTLPSVFVWHELGKGSLSAYQSHYDAYRSLEKQFGISPRKINITEYGELRDMGVPGQLIQWMSMFERTKVQAETAYWNYAGNLSDNMARANSANAGWWQFKWYADLRGTTTVKVTPEHPNTIDSLQGIAAIDSKNKKATVLYGGANNTSSNQVENTGANIPVTVALNGLDSKTFGTAVDVEVRENAYTGPDGVAASPRVVNVLSNAKVTNGNLNVTTPSADRYASYQLIVTPHQDRTLQVDNTENGRAALTIEAEKTSLSGGAQAYEKTPYPNGWGDFMFSGNHDVGNFKTGAAATWNATIPADGDYRLEVISANTGSTGTNSVLVDGKPQGDIQFPAELANKDAAKWKYRGSGEIVLKNLTKGNHSISVQGSSMDNTLDKLFLYQVNSGKDTLSDAVTYPASEMRLSGKAQLDFSHAGTDGFAALNGGEAKAFAHAWDAGYYDLTITYNAPQGTAITAEVNGTEVLNATAAANGLQKITQRAALAEGMNEIDISGATNAYLQDVTVSRAEESDASSIKLEAENLSLAGGANVVTANDSNASNKKFVAGLGNQFETQESGKDGFGDRTRVVTLDANNTPSVHEDNKGTVTIPAGKIPAGTYSVAVHFSNDAFIGQHDYNPQIVDLGLQIQENSKEVARSAFRYTFSEKSFLSKSMQATVHGGALTLGNWDKDNSALGAVSHGVAPNIDFIQFYPLTSGKASQEVHPKALTALKAVPSAQQVTLGAPLSFTVTAVYQDGSEKKLADDTYVVSNPGTNALGTHQATFEYTEGRITLSTSAQFQVVAEEEKEEPSTPQQPAESAKPVTPQAGSTTPSHLSKTGASIAAAIAVGITALAIGIGLATARKKGLN